MKAGMSEKRKMERFSLQLLARLSAIGEEREKRAIELLTKNISAGGMFIQADHTFEVGTQLKVEVILPVDQIKKIDGEKAFVKVTGSVIRSDEKGMAISFDEDYQILPYSDN